MAIQKFTLPQVIEAVTGGRRSYRGRHDRNSFPMSPKSPGSFFVCFKQSPGTEDESTRLVW